MPKTVNYTAELTQKIIDDYQNGSSVQEEIEKVLKKILKSSFLLMQCHTQKKMF